MAHVVVLGAGSVHSVSLVLKGRRFRSKVHTSKGGFEKYFLRKIRSGKSEPFYEHLALQTLGIDKLKAVKVKAPAE